MQAAVIRHLVVWLPEREGLRLTELTASRQVLEERAVGRRLAVNPRGYFVNLFYLTNPFRELVFKDFLRNHQLDIHLG